jgi:hypothetical protein
MKTEHEDKTHPCRIVGCRETTQAPRRARRAGATWLCAVHRAALRFTIRERTQLRELEGLILQEQLVLSDDGWLTAVAPKLPPKGVDIIMDDGSPRYRDWDNSAIVGDDNDGQV